MKKAKANKFIYWTPRVLSILFILFLMMFSLDVFEEGKSAGEIAIGLFMHNIPAFVLAFLTYLSWKREWIGGIAFTGFGLVYITRLLITVARGGMDASQSLAANMAMALSWSLTIAGPALLVGILYFVNWFRKRG